MPNLMLSLLLACKSASNPPSPAAEQAEEHPAALEVAGTMDPEADACEDFYTYACGGWLEQTELPPDRPIITRSFTRIYDENQTVIHQILEEAAGEPSDPVAQKLGDYYRACMDEEGAAAAGATPLEPLFEAIEAIEDRGGVMEQAGKMMAFGPNPFFAGGVWADSEEPTVNILQVIQDGLGLPDRSYYLDDTEERAAIRAKYVETMTDLFVLTGTPPEEAAGMAERVMALETALAEHHWERAALRDPHATTNKMTVEAWDALAPSVPLTRWLDGIGVHPEVLNVITPSYFEGLDDVLSATDLATLKAYLRWNAVRWSAPHLSPEIDARHFAFFGTVLAGIEEQRPRWKRCVERTDEAMGEWLGKAYVEARFAGESKEVAEEMVRLIFTAFEENLPKLEWMDDTTRERAIEKARAFRAKLGYPEKFRDYAELEVRPDDPLGNAIRAGAFNTAHELSKAGEPVDPDEWHMTPQMVNAYYNPTGNEIVFPAGIMQAPFFSKDYPRAMNFGALGMVIGHELTHGFDDEGRKYGPDGTLETWWEPDVNARFEERATCVEEQYAGWEIAGVHLNGELTLGENIADLGGLKMAYLAYRRWVKEHGEEPRFAGLTGDQLFFVAFAQGWCTLATEEIERVRAATDPHSPPRYRVNGAVMNFPAFAEAFGCEEGQPMAPEERCEVW